jgi:hypothetical protein
MKKIHLNSRASYQELLESLPKRQKDILGAICKMTAFKQKITDRRIKTYLMLDDMNQVRPRVTELIKKGHIKETGSELCAYTKKTVRTLDLS